MCNSKDLQPMTGDLLNIKAHHAPHNLFSHPNKKTNLLIISAPSWRKRPLLRFTDSWV